MAKQGRPRKEADNRLEERITVRLTQKDKAVLKVIADHKGFAPESMARSYIKELIRKDLESLGPDFDAKL